MNVTHLLVTHPVATASLPARLTAAQAGRPGPQEVTDWASRAGWVVGLVLFVALLYWLMRQGWKWRSTLQGDLPPLPTVPASVPEVAAEPLLTLHGRYHGSTTAGQWLDRIVAHGLGARSRAMVTLTAQGVRVERPGAQDFFIPAGRLRGARLDKGIAGKVLTEGGLLVITWRHGDRLLDSGFRSDHPGEHPVWLERLRGLTDETDETSETGETGETGDTGLTGGTGTAAPDDDRGANSPANAATSGPPPSAGATSATSEKGRQGTP